MVTVRQFGRGMGRAVRAMEREGRRVERQRDLYDKAMVKQARLEASANAADEYARLLSLLTGAHRMPFVPKDWTPIALAVPPEEPDPSDTRARAAEAARRGYAPGWFATTFGFAARRRKELDAAVRRAQATDEDDHRKAVDAATARRAEIAIAKSVLALDSTALLAAAKDHIDLSNVAVEDVSVLAVDGRVVAVVDAYELEDMPAQSVTLLQSGKASIKVVAPGKLLELHRDNVCSAAVRVGVEFLKALPIDSVEVVVETDLLDRATGHIDPRPILYLRMTAQALGAVNLQNAEPAPLAERLGACFDWHRRDGFRPIDLGPFDVPLELLEASTAAA